MKLSKKAIRKDHKLIIEVKDIEKKINDICIKLSAELDLDIGWSDARELANGMSPYNLQKLDK